MNRRDGVHMRKGKLSGCRIVAAVLSICLTFSSFSMNTISVNAQEDGICPEVYVRENGMSSIFVGNFMIEDGELYISQDTAQVLSKSETMAGDGTYLPFGEVLYQMGYTAEFTEAERLLRIRETTDYTELQTIMDEIYNNTAYNMFYWQNSGTYETDVEVALAADCIKNFAYTSYMSGHESEKQYEDAFWSILLPEEDANLDALTDLENTGKKLKDSYEIGEGVIKLIGRVAELKGIKGLESFTKFDVYNEGEMLDMAAKKFGDMVGYYQLDDVKELLIFTDVLRSTNEAAVRGLDVVLKKHKNVDKVIKKTGKEVLDIYKGEVSIEEQFLVTLVNENLLDTVVDQTNNFLYGPTKLFADIVNKVADARLNTQAQVNAVIGAARCLNIQKACGDYYKTLKKKFKNAEWDERDTIMRNMHDVTVAYLLAGAEAQRAVAIDKELKATSSWTLKCIDADLTILAEYHEEEFGALKELRRAEAQMIAYAEQLAATPEALELEPLEIQGTMTITWSGEGMNGWDPVSKETYMEPYDLKVVLEGGFDNDSVLSYATEGACFATDGKLVAQIMERGQEIGIEFYDMNAYYTITIENSFPDNGWTGNTQITLDVPGVSNFDAANYLNRGMTGFWYYRITLDHGIPIQAY